MIPSWREVTVLLYSDQNTLSIRTQDSCCTLSGQQQTGLSSEMIWDSKSCIKKVIDGTRKMSDALNSFLLMST